MKILDRYIVRSFLAPFGVCVIIFSVLVMLGRFFDKMDIFNRYHAQIKHIVIYLIMGLPYWLNLVLPVATMLALLFSLGQLQQRGEWTAFRSAGISSWRLFAPYIFIGLSISIFSLIGGLTFLPKLNFEMRKIYRVEIKKGEILSYRKDNVIAAGRNHRRFTIGWLDVENNELKDVVIDQFDDNLQWLEIIAAKQAIYQNDRWLFINGILRTRDATKPTGVREKRFQKYWVADIKEKPRDFVVEDKIPEDMTGAELVQRAKRLRRLGARANREQVGLHLRIALPFANMVVIALGIPFALRSGAHGRTQNFSYALVLAFLYWGTTSVCQSIGYQGRIPAWTAAWFSNGMFGSFALWRLFRTSL